MVLGIVAFDGLQFYCQMYKPNRSISELLKTNLERVQDRVGQKESKNRQSGLSQRKIQLNSHDLFSSIKKQEKQDDDNNVKKMRRSLSGSKSSLFAKAHQVQRNQSYNKRQSQSNEKKLSIDNYAITVQQQSKQFRKRMQESKIKAVVQRKLIISKVLQSENGGTKLSIRQEMSKLRLAKDNQLKNNQNQLQRQKDINNSVPHSFGSIKDASDLVISKDFGGEHQNQRQEELRFGLQSRSLIQSDLLNEQGIKNYSRQLVMSIQTSLTKQLQEHYLLKDKQREEAFVQKQKQYLDKFKTLQQNLQEQLLRERKLISSDFQQQLSKQTQKITEIKEENKKSLLKFQQILQKKVESSSPQKISNNERAQSTKRQNNQQILPPPPKIPMKKESQKNYQSSKRQENNPKENPLFNNILQVQTVNRQKSNQSEASSFQANNIRVLQPRAKNMEKKQEKGQNSQYSIYNDANDSFIEEIEEINLNTHSKIQPNLKMQKQAKQPNQRINQSFNVDKKLNDSFSSEKPIPTKKPQKIQRELSSKVNESKKITEQQSKIRQQQKRKESVKNMIKEHTANEHHIIALGEVAGYCSKLCKKSKLQWKVVSLLLYRYCFDSFNSFKPLYNEALQIGLIKQQQLDKHYDYDKIMEENLGKMYKSFQKKLNIPDIYKQIIESKQIQLERLKPYIILQANKYINSLIDSEQSKPNSGQFQIVQCGLRVINSVLIIKMLGGVKIEIITDKIEELSSSQTYSAFQKWSKRLRSLN